VSTVSHRGCGGTIAKSLSAALLAVQCRETGRRIAKRAFDKPRPNGATDSLPFVVSLSNHILSPCPAIEEGTHRAVMIVAPEEFEEFVASIRKNRPPAVTGYDGRACTEAALAAVMSHDAGKPVQLPL
jgi:hypothetical protein